MGNIGRGESIQQCCILAGNIGRGESIVVYEGSSTQLPFTKYSIVMTKMTSIMSWYG